MGKSAQVREIEDVDTLAAALVRFAEEAKSALADLDMELRRAGQWIEQDRPRYWELQVRLGWEAVARARREWEQARLIHRVDEVPSSCIDQKKALQRAQQRLELAMAKQQVVRQWAYRTAKQTEEYRGKAGPLVEWLEADYPRALATLRRMARSLECYVAQKAIPTPPSGLEAMEKWVSAREGSSEETPSAAGTTAWESLPPAHQTAAEPKIADSPERPTGPMEAPRKSAQPEAEASEERLRPSASGNPPPIDPSAPTE